MDTAAVVTAEPVPSFTDPVIVPGRIWP